MKAFEPFNVNMKKYLTIIVAGLGVAASPALLAQGCCGGETAMKDGCSMGADGMSGAHALAAAPAFTAKSVFMQPVQSVFDNYNSIQGTLAQDSLEGVAKTAAAMAKAIRGNSMKMLPATVGQQVEALSKANDLQAARAAFRGLSESLIQYLKDQKVPPGSYYEVYCPMAGASWLQTDTTVMNPYLGKGMIHCGQIKS